MILRSCKAALRVVRVMHGVWSSDAAGHLGTSQASVSGAVDLWRPGPPPAAVRTTHGVDEWPTLIAAGQAAGSTSEAATNQNPRPRVAYRTVRDTPPIPVRIAWWKDDPPQHLTELIKMICEAYRPVGSCGNRRVARIELPSSHGWDVRSLVDPGDLRFGAPSLDARV